MFKKKVHFIQSLLCLLAFMPRRRRSPSPSSSDLLESVNSVRCHPPGLHPLLPRLTRHELLHRLRAQALTIQRLIVMLGSDFRVSSSPVDSPDSRVLAALRDCLGLTVFIQGGFVWSMCPQPMLSSLGILPGSCLKVDAICPSDSDYSSSPSSGCSPHHHPFHIYIQGGAHHPIPFR